MSLIKLEGISRRYQMGSETIHALREVSLSIERGEYVAIMGPSGSGKSTLMNLLGCLDTPTEGRYELNGVDVSQMDDNQLAEIRNKEKSIDSPAKPAVAKNSFAGCSKRLRGEARENRRAEAYLTVRCSESIERNEAYESFSAAC